MLNNLLMTFQANRKLTYDILESLNDTEIEKKWTRPGLDTFSKHIQEMAAVTNAYAEAMETGNMDFSKVPSVFEFNDKLKKKELKELLEASDRKLEKIIEEEKYKPEVFWFDMNLPVDIHFVNIISHEVYHQGMMTLFLYQNKIQIPASMMENWSLPEGE